MATFAAALGLVDWRTMLVFNVAHVQTPERVYDNGEQRVTFRP